MIANSLGQRALRPSIKLAYMDSVRLAIDLGTSRTTAVAAIGDHRIPVVTADAGALQPTVKAALATPAPAPDAVPLVADHLRIVAEQARAIGEPAEAIVTAPAAWGPRRRELLRQAATQAGLPNVHIVADPIAAAAYAATVATIAAGQTILVCDLGTGFAEVSVVQREAADWTLLATQNTAAATANSVHAALSQVVARELDGVALTDITPSVVTAVSGLSAGRRAVIVPPEPHPPVVLTADQINEITAPARAELGACVSDAIDSADIDLDTLTAAIVLGAAAPLLDAAGLISDRYGIEPVAVIEPSLAIALGALEVTTPDTVATTSQHTPEPSTPLPWRSVRVRHILTSSAVGIMGSVILNEEIDRLNFMSGKTLIKIDYGKMVVFFHGPTFATAGLFLTLAAIAFGVTLATVRQIQDQTEDAPGKRAGLAGRTLAFAAFVGLTLTGLAGLLTETILGNVTGVTPNFVMATLAASFVPAGLCMAVGIIAPWIRRLRITTWAQRLHQPASAALVAGAGISLMIQRDLNLRFLPEDLRYIALYEPIARTGAGLLGVAVALTVIRKGIPRIVLATILSLGFAIVYGFQAVSPMTVIYLLAVTFWWLRQTALVFADGASANLLTRIRNALTEGGAP